MKKTLLAIASVLAIVAGCAKENLQSEIGSLRRNAVTASIEGTDTRATVTEYGENLYQQVWEKNDAISLIYEGAEKIDSLKLTLNSEPGKSYGVFVTGEGVEIGTASSYYAVYPYSKTNGMTSDKKLTVKFPNAVAFDAETGKAEGSNVMVAISDDIEKGFNFNNLCGYVTFTVSGKSDQMLKYLKIENPAGAPVNGLATLTFDEYGAFSGMDIAEGLISTTVNFGDDGVALSAEGLKITVALAPMFKDGFKATAALADGQFQVLETSTAVIRNKYVDMPAFEFAPAQNVITVTEDGLSPETFNSVSAAFARANAASAAVNMQLQADASSVATLYLANRNAKVTLDLNGHTLYSKIIDSTEFEVLSSTGSGAVSSEGPTIKVAGGADFTLTSGTIKSTRAYRSSSYPALIVWGYATKTPVDTAWAKATINGGELDGGAAYALTGSLSKITVNGGTVKSDGRAVYVSDYGCLDIKGGDFTSGGQMFYFYSYTHPVNIEGGHFSFTQLGYFGFAAGQLNLNGGYFNGEKVVGEPSTGKSYISRIAVKGGYYTFKPEPIFAGFQASEVSVTEAGVTYSYLVEKSTAEAVKLYDCSKEPAEEVGGYLTIAEALDEALVKGEYTDCKLVLQTDCSMSGTISYPIEKAMKLTLDLAGHKLTFPSKYRIDVSNDDAVYTLEDSVGGGLYEQTNTGSVYGVIVNKGKFILNGASIKSAATSAVVYAVGGFEMKSGSIEGEKCVFVKGGKATVQDGTLKCVYSGTATEGNIAYAIQTSAGGTTTVDGSNVSATYTGSASGVGFSALWVTGEGSSLTVSNSTVIGDKYGVAPISKASATFNDGSTVSGRYAVFTQSSATVNINGGTFTHTANNTIYVSGATLNVNGGTIEGGSEHALYCTKGCTCNITGGYVHSTDGYALYGYTKDTSANVLSISGGVLRSENKRIVYLSRYSGTTGSSNLAVTGGYFSTGQAKGTDDEEDAASTCTTMWASVKGWIKISNAYFDRHARALYVTNGGGTQSVLDTPINDPLKSKVGTTETLVTYDHQITTD